MALTEQEELELLELEEEEYQAQQAAPKKEISKLETFAKTVPSGLTFGFDDELAGASAGTAALLLGNKDIPVIDRIKEAYKTARDDRRLDVAEASEANPKTAFLGNVVGGGLGGGLIAAPKTILGAAKLGTGLGAVSGLGSTEDITDIKETAKDVALGAGIGGIAGSALKYGADKVFKKTPIINTEDDAIIAAESTIKRNIDDSLVKSNPKVTQADEVTAYLTGAKPDDVAYYKANKPRIDAQDFSLNEGAPNALSSRVVEDIDNLQNSLNTRRKLAEEIIESSNASTTNKEIQTFFNEVIEDLKGSKESLTDTGEDALNYLRRLSNKLVKKTDTGEEIVESWNSTDLKNYISGLWKDNDKFLNSRAGLINTKPDLAEIKLGEVTGRINDYLKGKVGPTYSELMDSMHRDLSVLERFKSMTKVNNWFKNRFVKPLEDKINGVSTERSLKWNESKNWLRNIAELQEITGTPYAEIVKDQLVLGRIFPEIAEGGQRGSVTANVGRAVTNILRGNVGGTARDLAESSGGLIDTAKRATVNRLIKEETEEGTKQILTKPIKTVSAIKKIPDKITGVANYLDDKFKNIPSKKTPTAASIAIPINSLGNYKEVLKKAQQEGGDKSLSSTHYILMQRDPEYRKKYEKAKESEK